MRKIVFVWSWKDNDEDGDADINMNWAHIYAKNCVLHKVIHLVSKEPCKAEIRLSLFYRLGNWVKKD